MPSKPHLANQGNLRDEEKKVPATDVTSALEGVVKGTRGAVSESTLPVDGGPKQRELSFLDRSGCLSL